MTGRTFVDALGAAPAAATPLEALALSLEAGGELVKLASVAAALTEGLHARGVGEPEASLAAETAMAVFRVAFERWLAEGETRSLPEIVRESVAALRAVAA